MSKPQPPKELWVVVGKDSCWVTEAPRAWLGHEVLRYVLAEDQPPAPGKRTLGDSDIEVTCKGCLRKVPYNSLKVAEVAGKRIGVCRECREQEFYPQATMAVPGEPYMGMVSRREAALKRKPAKRKKR